MKRPVHGSCEYCFVVGYARKGVSGWEGLDDAPLRYRLESADGFGQKNTESRHRIFDDL